MGARIILAIARGAPPEGAGIPWRKTKPSTIICQIEDSVDGDAAV